MASVIKIGERAAPRKKKRGRFLRGVVVTIGAMLLTSAAIKANDIWNTPTDPLIGGVGASLADSRCSEDMVYVSAPEGGYCIDRFEASAGKLCPHEAPTNQFDTSQNLAQPLCVPVSTKDASPWVNVPQSQARELCARVGKHLASNGEWYRAALGTPDEAKGIRSECEIDHVGQTGPAKTGFHAGCISSFGAYDMVGNVWEWVDGSVQDGTFLGRVLPDEGFVTEVDSDGVPVTTGTSSSLIFAGDYFFLNRSGFSGVFRGGFWSMNSKAGVTSVNAASPPSFIGIAVGFRCAK